MRAKKSTELVLPTLDQLRQARIRFEEYEPRDLFYRAATELVELALANKTKLTIGEALAVLLQTWNAQYYRFHPYDSEHFNSIDKVVAKHRSVLDAFRLRTIKTMKGGEFDSIGEVFGDFETVLGPVGAAKALYLLAPEFFPLWDRKITNAYGIWLGAAGTNAADYLKFMTMVVSQIRNLPKADTSREVLKLIDEFNYCRFTKRWL